MGRAKRIVRRILVWAAVALVTLVLCVVVAEVYLRWRMPHLPNLGIYEPDLDLGFRIKPARDIVHFGARTDISSQGMRDREFTLDRPAGTVRILALGDSWTIGSGVLSEKTWPKQLEALLAGGPVPMEVMNAGIDGYETLNEAAYYNRDLRKFRHDIVLVGFYPVNDVHSDPGKIERNKKMYAIHPWLYRFYEWQKKALYLQHVYHAWRKRREEKRTAEYYGRETGTTSGHDYMAGEQDWSQFYRDDYAGWRSTKESLRSIGQTARECGARGVVILFPDNQDLRRYRSISHPRVAPLVRQASEEAGLAFIDLNDAFAPYAGREAEISVDGNPGAQHVNALGYRIIAETVARELAVRGLLAPPGQAPAGGEDGFHALDDSHSRRE